MPLVLIRNDITKMQTDAIVNPTNSKFSGQGGTDGAIHRAAGPKLAERCKRFDKLPVGEAKITRGFELPCTYVIHTVGPIWKGGEKGEQQLLKRCYHNCLKLAIRHHCKSIAFPLISAGTFGYPKQQALEIATKTIEAFLEKYELTVYLVVYDKAVYQISQALYRDVQAYIDDIYADQQFYPENRCGFTDDLTLSQLEVCGSFLPSVTFGSMPKEAMKPASSSIDKKEMEKVLAALDESFSQMLLRKIDDSGMKDSECYKKANIDRKLFSKIRSDIYYKPSKSTVLAFAIALELSLSETAEMLQKAGYALSHSSKFDVIVEYFIKNKIYNIHTINQTLFEFDQNLLGNGL